MTPEQQRRRGRPRTSGLDEEIEVVRRAQSEEVELPGGSAADGDTRLTQRQRLFLETNERAVHGNGYPPSMRELGKAVGRASLSSGAPQLSHLERMGYLR